MLDKILNHNFSRGDVLGESLSLEEINKFGKFLKKNGFVKAIKRTSERGHTWER